MTDSKQVSAKQATKLGNEKAFWNINNYVLSVFSQALRPPHWITRITIHPWDSALSISVKHWHLLQPVCLHRYNPPGMWGQPSLKVNIAQAERVLLSFHLFPMNLIDFFSHVYLSAPNPTSTRKHYTHPSSNGLRARAIYHTWLKELGLSSFLSWCDYDTPA